MMKHNLMTVDQRHRMRKALEKRPCKVLTAWQGDVGVQRNGTLKIVLFGEMQCRHCG